MPTLVIKDLPPELHQRLKDQAARHRRSMTGEAIVLLEQGLGHGRPERDIPAPYRGRLPLTQELINEAKRQGRE